MTILVGFMLDVGSIDTLAHSIRAKSTVLNQLANTIENNEAEIQLTCADIAAFADRLQIIASLLQTRIALHRNRNPHVKA